MKFTNTELMQAVREKLIRDDEEYKRTGKEYVDPMFGSFFRDILTWTDEVVPRFSCEGHYDYVVMKGEDNFDPATMVEGKPLEEDAVALYNSDPYISFLCTEKGYGLIRTFYRELVKRSIERGFNPMVYQLTESVYYNKDFLDRIDGDTGRITLRILPYFAEDFVDYHRDVIELIKTTFFWACPLFQDTPEKNESFAPIFTPVEEAE